MFIYKPAKFAPVWTTLLKIHVIFVHQTLTERALCQITYFSHNSLRVGQNEFIYALIEIDRKIEMTAPVSNMCSRGNSLFCIPQPVLHILYTGWTVSTLLVLPQKL